MSYSFKLTQGDSKMYKRKLLTIIAIVAVLVSALVWTGKSKATSLATPGSGLTVEKLADGNLDETVGVKIKGALGKSETDVTKIQTYKFTFSPGAYSGWHQHGGPHMIVVASGTITYFEGDDPTCTPKYYPAGSAIFDPGFTTHYARNDGSVDAVVYITQLLPENGIFRIDVPAPGNCPF